VHHCVLSIVETSHSEFYRGFLAPRTSKFGFSIYRYNVLSQPPNATLTHYGYTICFSARCFGLRSLHTTFPCVQCIDFDISVSCVPENGGSSTSRTRGCVGNKVCGVVVHIILFYIGLFSVFGIRCGSSLSLCFHLLGCILSFNSRCFLMIGQLRFGLMTPRDMSCGWCFFTSSFILIFEYNNL
jgi:hypothetical protein